MGRTARWTLPALPTLLLCAGLCAAAEQLNVDLRVGWDSFHRPGQWVPLEIGVTSTRKEPLNGTLVISAQQDSVTRMHIRQPLVVTKEIPLRIPLVTKLSFGASSLNLRLDDEKGQTAWSGEFNLVSYMQGGIKVEVARDEDLLIGTSGRRSSGLMKLGQQAYATRANRQRGQVKVCDKLPSLLPWDWTGYACLDCLILSGLEWTQLNAHQLQGVVDYVMGGGKLLLVPGSVPWPTDGPLARLVPFGPGKPYQVRHEELPLLGGPGRSTLPRPRTPRGASQPATGPAEGTVTLWPLDGAREAGWFTQKSGQIPYFASGRVGFGRVGVLAFSPADHRELSEAADAQVWFVCLQQLLDERQIGWGQSPEQRDHYSYVAPDRESTNQVLEYLLTIPQLRPLNIWYVIGLLALLALMLGPIDYLLLKWLDRLPWTWVTSACTIAAFTVAAYYGVKYYRAGDLQVRAVTVVDCVPGQCAWKTTYAGIFAPDSDDYPVDGLDRGQWWSAISPARDEYEWQRESQLSGRAIYCTQQDGANLPYSLPISIYSMQCLLSESQGGQAPLSAELVREQGRLMVRVTNHLACAVSELSARRSGTEYTLPPLGPGQTASFPLEDSRSRYLSPLYRSACTAHGISRRTAAIDDMAGMGHVVVTAIFEQPPLAHTVQGGRGRVDHRMLVRLAIPPGSVRTVPAATPPAVESE